MIRWRPLALVALASLLLGERPGLAKTLKDDGRAGAVAAIQGLAAVRPVGRERWTPLTERSLVFPGDVVRTDARGANALELRLKDGGRVTLGPGASVEFADGGDLRLLRGEVEIGAEAPLSTRGPGAFAKAVTGTAWLSASETGTQELAAAPRWLTGYRASTSEEWMGSLLATVDGRAVPLTVGYHKVSVEIRDQIARTTVEQSFVNSTPDTLEGVFSFPLPADASIGGFAMWVGDEMVEADLVERERARAIYEDILRRKKDPGLLEWEGGNLFKARVYPIFPHGEKRIRIRYTQVLPREGDTYRWRYGLRSELLRSHPLRELAVDVRVVSTAPMVEVTSPTHPVSVRAGAHEATVEFTAQAYRPERDLEVAVRVGAPPPLAALSHRRGEDGFFLLLVTPPDPAAAGWQRDLSPEGAPLDLVLLADTSGSMDPASRAVQARFLSALLALAGPRDRFRLLACDVKPVPVVGTPTAATEGAAAAAIDALAARSSLGWTDLDAALAGLVGATGATTQVVYVGDGIATAGDADPVRSADRLRRAAAGLASPVHAVSTSSSYDARVLEALTVSGGSVRRADGGPVEAARALLGELARPGLRDATLTIEGVPTARVYPSVLPHVPLGTQHAVLGRFLPGPVAATATVTLSGRVGGEAVRFSAPLAVPVADEGNSFLPRLWARRHLDALLALGSSAAHKEEIVAFSREYQLLTPYTSFLVLENDEDRATYGVERTVKMRDAERFFADARDRAALEAQRSVAAAGRAWREGMRRQVLADIAGLRRDRPVPDEVAWGEVVLEKASERLGFAGPRSESKSDGGGGEWGAEELRNAVSHGPGSREPDESGAPMGPPAPRASARARDLTAGADDDGGDPGSDDSLDETDGDGAADEEVEKTEVAASLKDQAKSVRMERARRASRADDGGDASGFVARGGFAGRRGAATAGKAGGWGRGPSGPSWSPVVLGFPALGPAAARRPGPAGDDADEPAPKDWDPIAVAALRSLDRRAAFERGSLTLRATRISISLHRKQGRVTSWQEVRTVGSATRFVTRGAGADGAPLVSWLSTSERGVVDEARRLGRRREAAEGDRRFPWLPLLGRALGWNFASLRHHGTAPAVLREGDRVTLTFTSPGEDPRIHRLVIDVERGLLLEEAQGPAAGPFTRRRFLDPVSVGGLWFSTRAEDVEPDGLVGSRQHLTLEATDEAALTSALEATAAAHRDVVFLPAEDPALLAAEQAVKDGRAGLPERLVVALAHGASGRFDALHEAWREVEAFVRDRPGAAWMRLVVLAQGRRGVEALETARALAASVAATPEGDEAAPARGRLLDRLTSSLGARERLDLLETLRPRHARPGPDRDLRVRAGTLAFVAALRAVGDVRRVRQELETLLAAEPRDVDVVVALAQARRGDEDLDGALALLATRWVDVATCLPVEVEALGQHRIAYLRERRDLPGLFEAATQWMDAAPESSQPRAVRLTALYLLDRDAQADAEVLDLLNRPVTPRPDPVLEAARSAALGVALGQGFDLWAQQAPVFSRAALGDLAWRAARLDGPARALAQRILEDWRFRQTEEARRVLETLRGELLAPGAAAQLPVARLAAWVGWARGALDDAQRAALAEALLARWRSATERHERAALHDLVLSTLPRDPRDEARIAFRREVLARAEAKERRAAASALFTALVEAPHEAAREEEAFGLPPVLIEPDEPDVPTSDDPERVARREAHRSAAAATAARRLAAWVHEGRRLAALGTPVEQRARTRAQARTAAREALATARRETARRLSDAVGAGAPPLRTWYEVERLGYAAETLADLARLEGEAVEVLDAVPAGSTEAIDAHLADRAAGVLAYVATRRSTPEGLADRVLARWRARLAAGDRLLDPRQEIVDLLVALDRVEALETTLAGWIVPGSADVAVRVLLARVQAERGDLRAAAATMEAAAAEGRLDGADHEAVASWYLVLKEDARREAALDRALEAYDEHTLSRRLWQAVSRVSRRGDGVPGEVGPEDLRTLRHLLRKASWPQNYVHQATQLYGATKDIRVLEALAEGVSGHSPEAVYGFLGQVGGVLEQVHEEATLDTLAARLLEAFARATRPVDRRALRLLHAAAHARASAVPKTDPAHGPKALESLTSAFVGSGFVPGERLLYARCLAAMRLPVAGFPEEQLRQLLALRAQNDGDGAQALGLERAIADALWARNRREEAVDRLSAALEAWRTTGVNGGVLPPQAASDLETLVGWWEAMGRHRLAEERLSAEEGRETRSLRREALRLRRWRLLPSALRARATLSIGAGAELLGAGAQALERHLVEGAAASIDDVLAIHGDLHEAAHKERVVRDPGDRYARFVRDRLPAALARDPENAPSFLSQALGRVRTMSGPRPALAFALDHVERERPWRERFGRGVWEQLHGSMALWRREASAPDLDERLAPHVLRRLEASLAAGARHGGPFASVGHRDFWRARSDAFATVARRVAEVHADRPAIALSAAIYLRHGLGLKRDAVATLDMVVAHGKDVFEVRRTLATWLVEDARSAEALPHAERLVKEHAGRRDLRFLLVQALTALQRDADARARLEEGVAALRAGQAFDAGQGFAYGEAALRARHPDLGAAWLDEALARYRAATGGRVAQDPTLAKHYGLLAEARAALGQTDAAVSAASAAIVAWGRTQEQRQRALASLQAVLATAKDLDAFVARHDATVAASGADAPILRKALGAVLAGAGRPADAARQFRLARDLEPLDPEVHEGLVRALDRSGDPVGAVEALLASVRMAPKNLDAYPDLARRFETAKRPDEAERARTNLVEASPSEPDGHARLARLRAEAGRPDLAVVHWRNAARVRPDDPELRQALEAAERAASR